MAQVHQDNFCSCIGDANISALVTPLPYGRIIGDAFGDNLIAFYNDLILQNNLTDFLLCGFDIPNPIRRIRIKLPAENIEVLTAIANCFSKRDKRTIFKGFKVGSHTLGTLFLGQNRLQIFCGIWIGKGKISDCHGNIAIALRCTHVIAVGNSTKESMISDNTEVSV